MKDSLVIIPTYNEIENIETIIRAVFTLEHPFDILIVDDGSPDGTAQKVQELQLEFPHRILLEQRTGKLGLGTAYIHGFRVALAHQYAYIFEMDADFSHNPQDLLHLRQACVQGADVAIGSRYITGVNVVNWPLGRVLLSYFAGYYVRQITGMPIMDPTAGFKCYRYNVLKTIDLDDVKFVGYAFQIRMKFLAWKHQFKLQEVPIIFTDRAKGTSKMSANIINEAFFGVLKMKIESWFRSYPRKKKLS